MPSKRSLLILAGYLLGLPALFVVVLRKRVNDPLRYHADRAFLMWVCFFLIFFGLRTLINLLWLIYYVPQLEYIEILTILCLGGYAIWQGVQAISD